MERAELRNTVAYLEGVPSWDAQGNFVYPYNQPIQQSPSSTPKVLELPPGVSPGSWHGVPNGPPPGLVRVSPPIPAPVHWITDQDVSIFSDIAPYFETGIDEHGHPVRIDLRCQICQCSRLEMPCCVAPRGPGVLDHPVEPLSVLPCGHMFGSSCLEKWVSSQEEEEVIPCCPMCRFELIYRDDYCGHVLPVQPYDIRLPRNQQTPLTLPEGGCEPEACRSCTRDQMYEHARYVSDLALPEIPSGNFVPAFQDRGQDIMSRAAMSLFNDIWNMREWSEANCLFW
ncbi:hypothetical protein F4810DRAFT_653868 [Camillea tinctor]|nr:hypothetical protein F4810DRAFT_653868 [Camillea tinctor]